MKIKFIQKIIDKLRNKKTSKVFLFNEESMNDWISNNREHLRYEYDLNKNSIVFDVGGYHGDFTQQLYMKYGSKFHIFEPVEELFDIAKKKFEFNEDIKINKFGLSNVTKEVEFGFSEDASSAYSKDKIITCLLKDIMEYVNENEINHIDLIKLNIEGGEYDILERLIETGFVKNIDNIQVQFHKIASDSKLRMEKIQQALSLTHQTTYQYKFCWENWKLK